MRIRFPTRISLSKATAFAGTVFLIQQLEHTSLEFSLLFFGFVVLSTVAFNVAGGFSRTSGAYIFFFATLTCIIGVTIKLFSGEPANSNLDAPVVTMAAYTASMIMMLLAVLISRRLTADAPGIGLLLSPSGTNLKFSAIGCELIGVTLYVFYQIVPHASGTFLSAAQQIDVFVPVAIILATVDVVSKSNGEKSVNAVSLFGMAFIFVSGLTDFSKQAMFTPMAAWIVGAVYGRLRVRPIHVILCSLFAVAAFTILTPISQIGRDLPATTFTGKLQEDWLIADSILQSGTVQRDEASDTLSVENQEYISGAPLLQRTTMIKIDDRLISYTERNGPVGYAPVYQEFRNWIPHFLVPGKNDAGTIYSGNHYAHEIGGLLAPNDFTTGISFSPVAEAFRIDEWTGVFLLAPAIWILLFITTDLICGDVRRSPWGLMPIVAFSHVAPESLLGGLIYYIWFNNFGLIVAIAFCIYVTPILGSLLGTPLSKSSSSLATSTPYIGTFGRS